MPATMTITEIAGFAGAGLAGAAYVPQISHLIRARCSAGISRLAFAVWLLASVLVTVRAVAIGAGVFIVLGGIQIVATTLIVLCAARYKDTRCPSHLLPPPRAKAATRTVLQETSLVRRVRPAARLRHQPHPPGHGGALRASVPVLHPHSYPVTARPGREADTQAFRSRPKSPIAAAAPCANVAGPGRSRPCTGFQATHLRGTR